ncbi:MAG: TonB-dependent receptor [Petrimonas sp.]|jgi:iron complex outermembrane receptor protein
MNRQNQIFNKKAFRFKRFTRKSYSVFNSLHKAVTIGVLSGCTLMSAHAASVNPTESVIIQTKSDTIPEKKLDEVLVTASKAQLPLNMAAKLVTVITSKEIERLPVQSVEDLLTHFSGVDVLQRGPHGVQADITLRGGSFDQTAILLNGINLTNPQTGHYSLDIPINLSDIERIEIVQGPSSLVYGAGAFAGGINIITKKDMGSNLYAKLEGGMHALFGAEARGAYKMKSAGYRRSDGYIPNSDYKLLNLLWQSRFDVEKANIDFTAGYNNKNYGANTFYTAAYPNQYDDTESVFISAKGETFGKLKFIPQIYWNRHFDIFQLIREGTPDVPTWYTDHNYHRSDVFGMNLNMRYASRRGITSFGGEFRNESILSSILGKPLAEAIGKYTKADSRSNISFFLEHNFLIDNLTFSIGGLLNHNTAIPNKFVFYPAINTSYRFGENLSIYASWNKATRMPTFTDLYYTTKTHTGNTDLEAELSEAFEAGLKFNNPIIRAYLTAFYMKGRNIIDWVKPDADALWESRNHTKIDKIGFETGISLNLQNRFGSTQPFQEFSIGYMNLHQNLIESELISNYMLNHLKHKFTASLHHRIIPNLTLSWNFHRQYREGSYIRYTELKPGERVNYKPFSVVDVKANYRIRNWDIFANANNIFNTTYLDLGNLPQPGFWLIGGVSYHTR